MAVLPESAGFQLPLNDADRPTTTFLIDWETKQIFRIDSGLAAMQQTVDVTLHTERFRWQIFDSNFGRELEDLVGEEYDYIVSEFPRRMQEAFSVDNRVLSAENFTFLDSGPDGVLCGFDVVTVFGTIHKEVKL